MKGGFLMKKALVAIDQSDISKSLISYSFRYARQIGIEHLDFIHVMTYKDMTVPGYVDYSAHLDEEKVQQEMERIILEGKADSGVEAVPYELIMTGGTPYAEIVEMAEKNKYELILIGHRGLSNLERFFIGSVAAKVVRYAPCDVLVHRPKEE